MPPLSQDLTFKGPINGHMAWAHRGDQFTCGPTSGNGFVATPLEGYIAQGTFAHGDTDSAVYRLGINMTSGYVGTGAYHATGLKLFGSPTHAVPLTISPENPRKSESGRLTHWTGRRKGSRARRWSSTSTASR